MRTDPPMPETASGLSPLVGRIWSRVAGWPAASRWAMPLGALALLGVALYLLNPTATTRSVWLDGGRRFAPDEIVAITRALAVKQIAGEVDEWGRIGVPQNRLAEALALLAKDGLGARTLDQIEAEADRGAFWEAPADREHRRTRVREQWLGAIIQQFDDQIVSALVKIEQARRPGRSFPPSSWDVKALVILRTQDDRPISYATVERIQSLMLSGVVAGLELEGLSVLDKKRSYLEAGQRTAGLIRAREHELASAVASRLRWIRGVQVSVRFDPMPSALPSDAESEADRPPAASSEPVEPPPSMLAVGVNMPVRAEPRTPTGPASATRVVAADASAKAEPAPTAPFGQARVLVLVPQGYYLRLFQQDVPDRPPAPADLQPYIEKTQDQIRTAIDHVIGPGERGEVTIDWVPEVVPRPEPLGSSPERSGPVPPWSFAALAGGLVVVVVAVVLAAAGTRRRALAGRRAAPPRSYTGPRGASDRGETSASGRGPLDRVRDLVRLEPEAAAGVLQRWVGTGGGRPA